MGRAVKLIFTLCLLSCTGGTLFAQEEAATECPSTIAIPDTAELFVSIRRYDDVDPADLAEINRYAATEFLPLLKESAGFLFYATMKTETNSHVAVNIFTSEEEMMAANALAAEHVTEYLSNLIPPVTEVISGPVQLLLYANHCPEADLADDTDSAAEPEDDSEEARSPGYMGFRVYREIADWEVDIAAANELVREEFAPVISAAQGFILFFNFLMPEEAVVAVNLFASQAELTEANAQAAQFIAAEFSEIITGPPTFYGGSIVVLDQSGLFSEEEVSEETEED